MKILKNKVSAIISIVFGLALVSGVFGNACGGGFSSSINDGFLSLQNLNNEDIVPIEGKMTVSTSYSKQFLVNLLSCTGVQNPSVETLLEFENRKGSVSEYGYATKVTAPMLMAYVSIAGEVCQDLVDLESSSSNRRIFSDVDFDLQDSFNGQFDNSLNRLARSCWQRNETLDEQNIINGEVYSESVGPRAAAVILCTSMLGSVSSYEM